MKLVVLACTVFCATATWGSVYDNDELQYGLDGLSQLSSSYGQLGGLEKWSPSYMNALEMDIPQMSMGKKEVSINGRSYFVHPSIAQRVALLPDHQKLAVLNQFQDSVVDDDWVMDDTLATNDVYSKYPKMGMLWNEIKSVFPQVETPHQLLSIIKTRFPHFTTSPHKLLKVIKTRFPHVDISQLISIIKTRFPHFSTSQFLSAHNLLDEDYVVDDDVVFDEDVMFKQPRMLSSYRTPRMSLGSYPTKVFRKGGQNVIKKNLYQQRVLRTPISKTLTVLPDEVTHITKNINTNMPMLHDRERKFYTVEDTNRKNTVHHYIEPVENKYLGLRKGVDLKQATQNIVHRNRKYSPSLFTAEEEILEDVALDGLQQRYLKY